MAAHARGNNTAVCGHQRDALHVPPGQTRSESLSFLGADYGSAIISRVRIVNGNAVLGPNETTGLDLVVMDDFIYGEPAVGTPVPEPASMTLLAMGMIGVGVARSRRDRNP